MAFVKIHGTILDSSIWSESPIVCKVWITMLAMADEQGVVNASVDGLARRAVVPIDDCEAALSTFMGPDRFSRDGTSGERIEPVPGGWLVLNHAQYRDKRTAAQIATAARVKRHRERRRAVTANNVTPDNAKAPSEAEAEAEAEKKKTPRPPKARLDPTVDTPAVRTALADWISYRKQGKWALPPMTIDRLPERILKMGAERFITAVAHTIDQGWRGLREPDERSVPASEPTGGNLERGDKLLAKARQRRLDLGITSG